jgi:hypothetical protein
MLLTIAAALASTPLPPGELSTWTARVDDAGLNLTFGAEVASTTLRDVSDNEGALPLDPARRRARCAAKIRPCRATVALSRGLVEEEYAWVDGALQYRVEVARAGSGPLLLRYAVDGALPSLGRHDVAFSGDEGRFSWTGLHAADANGRALPVRFAADPRGVAVIVDARAAAWPVQVARTVRVQGTLAD